MKEKPPHVLLVSLRAVLVLVALLLALILAPSFLDTLTGWKPLFIGGICGAIVLNLWFIKDRVPAFPAVFAVALFMAVALTANGRYLARPANMLHIATLTGRVPWTFGHSLGLVVAAAYLLTVWKPRGKPQEEEQQDSEEVISGPSLISQAVASFLARGLTPTEAMTQASAPKEEDAKRPSGRTIFWGGLDLPESCATEHFAIVGTPGSGKTLSLQLLMKSMLPTIGKGLNRRAVIYDAKRDTASFLAGLFRKAGPPVHIFNPFDRRSSPWAMNQDIREGATAHEIASILITNTGSESQPFFVDASRALLGGVMHSFSHIAPDTWTLRDVVLTMRHTKRIAAVIAACEQTEYLLAKYVTGSSRDNDIEATIETFMRGLSFVAAAWHHAKKPAVSLESWIKSESILVLGADPKFDQILQQINRAAFKRIVELTRRMPDRKPKDTRQTWFIIDELRNAGNLEDLDKLLVEGRSKGACVVLGFQDLAGLRQAYGEKRADEIIGACANKVFLQNGDQTTIDYATRHFKSQEVIETRVTNSVSKPVDGGPESKNVSVAKQRVTRPVVPDGLLKSLPKPSPGRHGLSGYCDTAAVGTLHPYRMEVTSAHLDEHLPKLDYSVPGFEDRAPQELDLPEWDMADLARLNLAQFPELLAPGKEPPPSSSQGGPLDAI